MVLDAGVRRATLQRGGAMSLLLALLVMGAIVYFALRSNDPRTHSGGTDTGNALGCEPRVSAIVQQTGGVGPAAKTAWNRMPPECRRLMPDPSALDPSPTRSQEN